MFKFLRKYNTWILAVGGTLLMIVFLIPQAIQTLSQRAAISGAAWATVGENEEEVSAQERDQCLAELDVLDRLRRADPTMMITDRPEHWYLLVREAEQAGLIGGRAIDQIPAEQMQVYAAVAASPVLDDALAKRLAVRRMLLMYQDAGKISDTRIRRHTRKQFYSVDARMLVLEASAEADVPDPTEEEILAQFEAYRDVVPGEAAEGEGPGFGYKLPDRFKVEWLRIPTEDVRALVEQSGALDLISLFKHWKRYELERTFPPVDESADVPEQVRDDLLDELTATKRDEIRKFASDQFITSQRRLKTSEDYLVLPDDWAEQRVDFGELARQIQEAFPGLALPTYEAIGDRWLTFQDVAELEGLGTARSDKYGPRPVTADALIASAKEFGGAPPILTQAGVASSALEDSGDQSVVFFRITDTDPARPPHDVDEVRDEVVRDLRRKADYEQLLARSSSLEADARTQGLLTVALENELDVQPTTSLHLDNANLLAFQMQQNFSLTRSSALPVLGQHVPTVERIVEEALRLTADRALSEVPREERTFAVPVDDRMALLIVELVLESPVSREQYTQLTGFGLRGTLLLDELQQVEPAPSDVFGYEAMRERHHFKVTGDDGTEDAEDGVDAEATATADGG